MSRLAGSSAAPVPLFSLCALVCICCTSTHAATAASRRVVLVQDGRPRITIVHGRSLEAAAQKLCEALKRATGVELPRLVDDAVVDGHSWRFREEWANRPTLLLGSIYDNRALLGLACRRTLGANSVYPGEGRYELRTLFSPLRRGVDVVVLAAVDEPSLSAGMERLACLTAKQPGAFVLPATIEIGGPDGVDAPSRKSKGGFRITACPSRIWACPCLRACLRHVRTPRKRIPRGTRDSALSPPIPGSTTTTCTRTKTIPSRPASPLWPMLGRPTERFRRRSSGTASSGTTRTCCYRARTWARRSAAPAPKATRLCGSRSFARYFCTRTFRTSAVGRGVSCPSAAGATTP